MNKRVILILLGVLFVLTLGGFFIWKSQQSTAEVSTDTGIESKTKENNNNYPKMEEYQVPILMYHYIRNAEGESELGKNLSVSPDNFAAQLAWLKENDYTTIKMSDLADPEKLAISKAFFEKKKPIVLTFDDGYQDAYTEAFPILKKYGFCGTFYIIRGYVGDSNYMNQEQIDELKQAGMEIGSHSLSHPDLSTLGLDDVKTQIFDSKKEAASFCYPSGKYNDGVVALIKEAGYSSAVTTQPGIVDQNSNLFELPRVRIENGNGDYLAERIKAYE